MKTKYIIIVLVIVGAIGFIAGRLSKKPIEAAKTTEIKIDSSRYVKPSEKHTYHFGSIPVAVFVHDTATIIQTKVIHDTTFIYLDREYKEYSDSTYSLAISGYDPRLEWINTYNKTITKTIVQKSRWSFGLQAGAGFVAPIGQNPGFGGYVGFGAQFDF